jgi:hypothetical protein
MQKRSSEYRKKYIAFYKKTGESGVTQSALDLNKLPTVGRAIDSLGEALLKVNHSSKGKILEARIATLGYEEPTYVDLTDLAMNISK